MWVWSLPGYNERICAQRGGFIIEANSLANATVATIISEAMGADWDSDQVVSATSVLGVPSAPSRATRTNSRQVVPMFTLRVAAAAKPKIQEFLEHRGLTNPTMSPDLAGLIVQLRSHYPTE